MQKPMMLLLGTFPQIVEPRLRWLLESS